MRKNNPVVLLGKDADDKSSRGNWCVSGLVPSLR